MYHRQLEWKSNVLERAYFFFVKFAERRSIWYRMFIKYLSRDEDQDFYHKVTEEGFKERKLPIQTTCKFRGLIMFNYKS